MHTLTTKATSSVPGRRTMAVTTAALAAAAGLLIATSGAGASTLGFTLASAEAPAKSAAVPIKANKFTPSSTTVKVGQSVIWTNLDSVAHTVTTTQAPVAFDSGVFKQNQTFTYKFDTPGTYGYYCAVHPEMVAEIIVLDKDGKQVANPAPAKPANPIAGLLAPFLPSSPQHAMGDMPMGDKPDPMAEHTPDAHGDNTSTGASDSGVATSAYPYAPAADPVSGAANPLMAHLEAAHFNRGAGGQVQDIAEFDTWGKSHEFLARQMLEYEIGKDSTFATTPIVGIFGKHLDATHFNQSPMEQADAIANFDSWNASHLALVRLMLDPAVGKQSALGSAPVTGVFMKHLDAAHWNTSANGQATAITDDLPNWLASHQALVEAMIASGQAAMSGQAEPGHTGHGPAK